MRLSVLALAGLLAVSLTPAAARAEATDTECRPISGAFCPSLALGAFVPSDGGASGGIVLSTTIPHVPTAYDPRITLALPLDGDGRFAATGEARTVGREYAGAGVGYGRLGYASGFVFDALIGFRLLPRTSLAARFYGGGGASGGAGFVGVRLGF